MVDSLKQLLDKSLTPGLLPERTSGRVPEGTFADTLIKLLDADATPVEILERTSGGISLELLEASQNPFERDSDRTSREIREDKVR